MAGKDTGEGASAGEGVVFRSRRAADGRRVAIALLDSPGSLNALSHKMALALTRRLVAWRDDPDVSAVVLGATSGRAFCAGGDIRGMHRLLAEGRLEEAGAFFADEYRLDRLLHRYPKPTVCWGSGIVMGGGMGLMQGCAVRIATETTRIAMPETMIGFYPDVGAARFLRRAPRGSGLFLGISGARLDTAGALDAGLADAAAPSGAFEETLRRLARTPLTGDPGEDRDRIIAAVGKGREDSRPPRSDLGEAAPEIAGLTREDDLAGTLGRWKRMRNRWGAEAIASVGQASPGMVALWWDHWMRTRRSGLDAVFRRELRLSMACCRDGEFREGVRALLIDKDRRPRWRFGGVAEVDDAWVQGMAAGRGGPRLEFIPG